MSRGHIRLFMELSLIHGTLNDSQTHHIIHKTDLELTDFSKAFDEVNH